MKYLQSFFLFVLAFLSSLEANAQISAGNNAFIQYPFFEVAISANGKLMTKEDAPSVFHSGGLWKPCVSIDLDRDGWKVGYPKYFPGWFSNGYPVEYWELDVDGVRYAPNTDDYTFTVPGDTGYISDCLYTPGFCIVTWIGNFAGVQLKKRYYIDKDGFFVRVQVQLTNTNSYTVRNVYYGRESEADFVDMETRASNSVSYNRIVSQAGSGLSCVRQTAESFWRGIVHMASTDCRSKAYFLPFGLRSDIALDSLYKGLGRAAAFSVNPGDSLRADVGMGLVLSLDSLKSGEQKQFSFWYLFEETYSILPILKQYKGACWSVRSPLFGGALWGSAVDTVRICDGDSATIAIVDGNDDWQWLPHPYLSGSTGLEKKVPVLGTETYRAIRMSDDCGTIDTFQITILGFPSPHPDLIVSGDWLSTSNTYKTYGWRRYGYDLGVNTPTYRMRLPGCYSIWVIDSNGCLGSSDTICYKLAIDESALDTSIRVFPNPANDYLSIICTFQPSLELYDVSGRLLMQSNNSRQIPVKDLSAGMYLLRVSDEEGRLRAIQKVFRE